MFVVPTTRMVTLVPSHTSIAKGGVKRMGWPHSMVRLGAQVITGGVVSTTVIVWLHTLLLPQESVALQVRTMLVRPGQRGTTLVVTVPNMRIITFVPSQMSTAYGGVKANGCPHSTI